MLNTKYNKYDKNEIRYNENCTKMYVYEKQIFTRIDILQRIVKIYKIVISTINRSITSYLSVICVASHRWLNSLVSSRWFIRVFIN